MKKEKILIFIFLISFIFAGFKANALESIYYFVNLKLSINQGQVGTTVNKQTTSMQKLNNGYDNINVADGEFKQATLYGQTLVNLTTQKSARFNGVRFLRLPLAQTLKANTKYLSTKMRFLIC